MAVSPVKLISNHHRRLYVDYYRDRGPVESKPSRWLGQIEKVATKVKAKTILDYGCGAAKCISGFSSFAVADYDPGLEDCDDDPQPADLVVCVHTLEHVEPDCVDAVIEHMCSLALKAIFVVVCCDESTKVLPDGSPWHSFVRDPVWWRVRLAGFAPQPLDRPDRPDAEYAALKIVHP